MITKRDKVQIVLNHAEYMALQKAKSILEDYVNQPDNDLDDLNDQIFEYVGIDCSIGVACDTLQYICDNSIVED